MKRKRSYTGLLLLSISFVIVLVIASIFLVAWNDYYRNLIVDPFYQKGALLLTVVYMIQYFLFSKIYGGFKIGYLKVTDIIFSQSLSITFTNLITYMQISLLAKVMVNPFALIIMTLIDIVVVIVWSMTCSRIYFNIYPPINMLVVYKNESVISLLSKMNNHKDKYNICAGINIADGIDVVQSEIDKYEAIIISDIDSFDRNKLVKYCYKKSIGIYLIPEISDIIINSSEKLHIFDTPLLLCKNQGLPFEQRILKRVFDVILSLLAIVILSPFMILTGLAIKVYDGGPIMYKQNRLTVDNEVFEIYKFRSMVVDAEKNDGARLASQNDDRITPVGKFIRKIRFDELPQLFNILKGDMSIVGPRPERPEIAELYIEELPEFEFRTKVKSGLTGYAQVMGKYNTTPLDKLKLDLMYISNYSIFQDLKIVLMTIKILFNPESTEGVMVGDEVGVTGLLDNELLHEFLALDREQSNYKSTIE